MDKHPAFLALKDEALFEKGKIDIGGFGIVWNDQLDISSEAIYEQGEKVTEEYSSLMFNFSVYLKELRAKNNLSQNDLSHISGVAQSTIARIENGDIDPSLRTVERILGPFGLSLSIKQKQFHRKKSFGDYFKALFTLYPSN